MKIVHLAIWVKDLEATKAFYARFFNAVPNQKYHNPTKRFSSYFLTFPDNEVTLELMHHPEVKDQGISLTVAPETQKIGLIHFAISVGSRAQVDSLTETLRKAGHTVLGEPRTTGDGFYESVVADPEGNMIEITV